MKTLVAEDAALVDARLSGAKTTMPRAEVAANQGKLLYLIALMTGARRVLEFGTLAGYSTIWLARAVGPAAESAAHLAASGAEPFDLFFIDADKRSNPEYLAASLRLARPGSVIVGDNVVRDGLVASATTGDARVDGVRVKSSVVV